MMSTTRRFVADLRGGADLGGADDCSSNGVMTILINLINGMLMSESFVSLLYSNLRFTQVQNGPRDLSLFLRACWAC